MRKVKILKQLGQTGLRLAGTIMLVKSSIADHWVTNGWAEIVRDAKTKPKTKTKTKK